MKRITAFALATAIALAVVIPASPVFAGTPPAWYGGYAPYISAYQTAENGGQLPTSIGGGIAQFGSALQGTMKYALYDINKNGSPELIVGKSNDYSQYYSCDIYTMDGGATSFLIWGGWESSIRVNTGSISYGSGQVIGCDEEFSLSPGGELILEYKREYNYDSDELVSETGNRLNDTPADLNWKPLSEYANELTTGQNIGPSNWAIVEVNAAISAGLVPENLRQNYQSPIPRGSVAQMIINLIEKSSGQSIDALMAANGAAINNNAFSDTNDEAVLAANALGIINGVGDSKFAPDGTLTRSEATAIINRIARLLGVNTNGYSHQFTDVGGHWVSPELGWPVHAKIINGVGDNKFDPDTMLTTEQAIAIFGRALAPLSDAASNRTDNDYSGIYEDLIAEWKTAMNNYKNGNFSANDRLSFHFYNGTADSDSMEAYYAFYDIDGNGVAELILRKKSKHEDIIAYIFGIKDGIPVNVFGYYDMGSNVSIPNEVPWSRVGTSRILTNGFIDSSQGDYSIYKIAADGYSVVKVASAEPYDYPYEAALAEAKWRYYLFDTEVDYSEYNQYLSEQVHTDNGNDAFSIIGWQKID